MFSQAGRRGFAFDQFQFTKLQQKCQVIGVVGSTALGDLLALGMHGRQLEHFEMVLNPVDESSTPVIDNVLTDILNQGGAKMKAVSIRGDQMDGSPAFFDNLRVGLSFNSVTALLADFDQDGDVDGDDFLIWQCGESPNPLSPLDLDEWQKYFGTISGSIPPISTEVPEPTTGIILVLGMVASLLYRHAAMPA